MNAPHVPHGTSTKLLPVAAMLLASAMNTPTSARAQPVAESTLKTVTVKDKVEPETASKESLLVRQSGIAKGRQELKDIPQTVTVMTEKLISDRNLYDFREVLRTTSGITFLAGETGEEDVRLRGFSLTQSGDIYVDGLRDVPMTERDTFNLDRAEVLKGSASMLFGKGSTGGVVNQVNKQAFLMDQHEANLTVGSGQLRRLTGDFNLQTGESAALRINALKHQADNWGAKVDKKGIAPTYRWGIGERDEYSVGLYHLETDGRPLYSHPQWTVNGRIVPLLDPKNYYGLASDSLRTDTHYGTFSHVRRLGQDSQIKTQFRQGHYERDLLGSATRFASGTTLDNFASAVINRSPKGRRAESDITQLQSDYTGGFEAWGLKHSMIAGVDFYDEKALRNNSTVAGLVNPPTNVATPNDGAVASGNRAAIPMATFNAQALGLYAQDTLRLSQAFKIVAGLRLDHFKANYLNLSQQAFSMSESLWSPRLGALWHPDSDSTYYTSWGQSYNTQGDTYQWTPSAASGTLSGNNLKWLNTPPEKSRNFELGAKFNVFNRKGLLGLAFFRSEKFNERNLDEPTENNYLLSGKRHATGMEFNFAGRVTAPWEVFYNHTWIPDARIDEGTAQGSKAQGARPGLTPKHSASLWSTYQLSSLWRTGAGVTYRSQQTALVNDNTANAFSTVDAMVEHTLTDNALLKLNVTNLGNKRYADQLYTSFYIPGAPRRIELSLKTLF